MPYDANGTTQYGEYVPGAGNLGIAGGPLFVCGQMRPDVIGGGTHRTLIQVGTGASTNDCVRLRCDSVSGQLSFHRRNSGNTEAKIAAPLPTLAGAIANARAYNTCFGVLAAQNDARCHLLLPGATAVNTALDTNDWALEWANAAKFNSIRIGAMHSGGGLFDGLLARFVLGLGLIPTDAEMQAFHAGDDPTVIWPTLDALGGSVWEWYGNEGTATMPDLLGRRPMTLVAAPSGATIQHLHPELKRATVQLDSGMLTGTAALSEDPAGTDVAEDGDRVPHVRDASPRKFHFTQSTVADQPRCDVDRRGHQTALCDKFYNDSTTPNWADGEGRFVDGPGGLYLPSDFFMLSVCELNNVSMGPDANQDISFCNIARPSSARGGLIGTGDNMPTTSRRITTDDGNATVLTPLLPTCQRHVLAVRWNGNNWTVWRNTQSASGSVASRAVTLAGPMRWLGTATDDFGWNGRGLALHGYNRVPDDAEALTLIRRAMSDYAVAETPKARLIVFGTSTLDGWGSSRAKPLWKRLQERSLIDDWSVRSYCIPGTTYGAATYGMLARLDDVIAHALDAPVTKCRFVMQIGPNDIATGTSAATVLANIQNTCVLIRSALTTAGAPIPEFAIVTMHYRNDLTAPQETQRQALNAAILSNVNRGVTYDYVIPVHTIAGMNNDDAGYGLYFTLDTGGSRIHPNEAGHEAYADLAVQVLHGAWFSKSKQSSRAARLLMMEAA